MSCIRTTAPIWLGVGIGCRPTTPPEGGKISTWPVRCPDGGWFRVHVQSASVPKQPILTAKGS
ncbi:hypothetical protein BR93DRAFT_922185 [Coniochaeta sp. PMI_546]|nr:hypothetical protein BR93DRAFT_922185 [Coniochaeta sp. PMI_546]